MSRGVRAIVSYTPSSKLESFHLSRGDLCWVSLCVLVRFFVEKKGRVCDVYLKLSVRGL